MRLYPRFPDTAQNVMILHLKVSGRQPDLMIYGLEFCKVGRMPTTYGKNLSSHITVFIIITILWNAIQA